MVSPIVLRTGITRSWEGIVGMSDFSNLSLFFADIIAAGNPKNIGNMKGASSGVGGASGIHLHEMADAHE